MDVTYVISNPGGGVTTGIGTGNIPPAPGFTTACSISTSTVNKSPK